MKTREEIQERIFHYQHKRDSWEGYRPNTPEDKDFNDIRENAMKIYWYQIRELKWVLGELTDKGAKI